MCRVTLTMLRRRRISAFLRIASIAFLRDPGCQVSPLVRAAHPGRKEGGFLRHRRQVPRRQGGDCSPSRLLSSAFIQGGQR